MTLTLKMACWDYDRTRPLVDGRVTAKDIALDISLMRPREAFRRMLEHEEFDIAEVSLANYVRLKAEGDTRFVAIPVALSKMFRHSCIYVRAGSGITTPIDLRGRRVGVSQIDSTGIVFIKGMLQHDHGVTPAQMNWVVGGLETSMAAPKGLPQDHGAIECLPEGRTLMEEFAAARLDAILSNHMPSNFKAGTPDIHRLFKDFKAVEQDYYRRTSIFPVMHVVALRAEIHRRHPLVAKALYQAFCRARDVAVGGLYDTDALRLALPWLIDHIEETVCVFGKDLWSYGLESNRAAWQAICSYQVEQGLTKNTLEVDELFVNVE
jgi:4,5-dihydroxyphthalate decarboxylase